MTRKKVLFLVTEDWYFVSHRLGFAKKLIESGFDVSVATRVSDCRRQIESVGITVHEIPFARERLSPLAVVKSALAVRKVIRDTKPSIVHLVALRSILVGSISSIGMKRPPFVNAITGLGSLFSPWKTNARLRLVRGLVELALRIFLNRRDTFNVWQNEDDMENFARRGISPKGRSWLIRGAGIDFLSRSEPPLQQKSSVPIVLFVGRFLKEKGVGQLLQASNILLKRKIPHVIRLVGSPDDCNPLSFSSKDVAEWEARENVEYLGRRSDIDVQMRAADVIALPSYYREGLPRVLLESGLAGRAAVTCDIPGCRDVIRDGVTGFLVKPRDVASLAEALEKLLVDPALRERMGSALFSLVRDEFSEEVVSSAFLKLYSGILEGKA